MQNKRHVVLIVAIIIIVFPLVYAVATGIGVGPGASAQSNAVNQICFGRGAAAATIYVTGDRFDIYAIDAQDNGELVMSFSQEYLRTIPAEGEARLLGESDRHIPISFYRNANRLYRMVAGPDAGGKFFECTFNAVCSHERTWVGETNRPTDEVVPVCNTGSAATQTANTLTPAPSNTLSSGPANTPTHTFTPTDTATDIPTNTPTDTPTDIPTNTPTNTDLPV